MIRDSNMTNQFTLLRQRGVSLIELMLASLLGSILLTLLLRCFCDLQLVQQQINMATDLQQRGRFLSYYFSRPHFLGASGLLRVQAVSRRNSPAMSNHDAVSYCVDRHDDSGGSNCKSYFLAKTSRRYEKGQRVSSFFERQPGRRRSELVAGVVDFQVRYWMDQSGRWLSLRADQIQRWSDVKVVEMIFLLRSLQPVLHPNKTYWMLGLRRKNYLNYELLPWVIDIAI